MSSGRGYTAVGGHTLSYAACFVQALAAIITPHFGVAG